jgi:hypothetical protein
MTNFFNHTKEDVKIFSQLLDKMKRQNAIEVNEVEDMFFDLSSQFINDKHAWWLIINYYDPLGMWKKVLDEFEIETKDPYLDFEPLLWYEKDANDAILNKVWQTPDKKRFDKRLLEFGIKFHAISKDLPILDDYEDLKEVEVLEDYRVTPSVYITKEELLLGLDGEETPAYENFEKEFFGPKEDETDFTTIYSDSSSMLGMFKF